MLAMPSSVFYEIAQHKMAAAVRTYDEECSYLEKVSNCAYRIKKGFVPNMKVCCMISHSLGLTLNIILKSFFSSNHVTDTGGRSVLCERSSPKAHV